MQYLSVNQKTIACEYTFHQFDCLMDETQYIRFDHTLTNNAVFSQQITYL